MLQATGMIVEYNPFHNGHLYHLQQARKRTQADVLVAVMSGNYLQRGEPAVIDKWQRTKAALANGVDLVVELPLATAVEPADRFAQGALAILSLLGCSALAFGTENEQIDYQAIGQKLAALPARHTYFRDYKQTYATQLNQYYRDTLNLNIDTPNQLLALSYATSNAKLPRPLKLIPIARSGSQYLDQELNGSAIASATAIRHLITAVDFSHADLEKVVPNETYQSIVTQPVMNWTAFFPYLKYKVESSSLFELGQIYQMTEGLEYRFKKVVHQTTNFSELLRALKSKRYTYTRLQRVCLYILLNIKQTEIMTTLERPYIRLLGFNEKGQAYLHQIKQDLKVPLISRVDQEVGGENGLLALEVKADWLYEQQTGRAQDFGRSPLRV
ncbi:nucleotidyltransferase [Loigolactobacillus iwatensis]|uniref:nucleotidyltransferase n=1 Tax=Loigolactobacillus iwatensis TaxID=1267156 RepID=UPI000F7DEADA|nr:nucleotidyltransferase [Loigolactobacillus iwatensis]